MSRLKSSSNKNNFSKFKSELLKNNYEVFNKKISKKFKDKIIDEEKKISVIHFACIASRIDTVKLLIKHNCNIECEDIYKRRPIHFACHFGFLDIAKILINNNCDIECEDDLKLRPIHLACHNGYYDIVKFLIKMNCNIDCQDKEKKAPIYFACKSGYRNIVELLISKKCNIECEDENKQKPIHVACLNGFTYIVKLLIDHNCNIECEDKNKFRPIHLSCQNGYVDIVKIFIDKKCIMECKNNEKQTPIHLACYNGNTGIVKILIEHNCNIECEDIYKWTALHVACCNGHLDIVKLLMEHNCNIECEDVYKWRPIHLATCNGYLDIVHLLIENKCKIVCEAKDIFKQTENGRKEGNSLLHWATKWWEPSICKLLIKAGAKVDCLNKAGNNPLIELLTKNNYESITDDNMDKIITIVNILCESGSKIEIKSSRGIKLIRMAHQFCDEKLMLTLIKHCQRLSCIEAVDFKTAFRNHWFAYGEKLMELIPNILLSSYITNDIIHLTMSYPQDKLLISLYTKAKPNVQQSVIEDILYNAASTNNYNIFQYFINVDISEPKYFTNGETVLTRLLKTNKLNFAWILLQSNNYEKYANLINKHHQTPLHIAIKIGAFHTAMLLIRDSDNLNYEDEDGCTPLMELLDKISHNNNKLLEAQLLELIKSIIFHGGDVYQVTRKGKQVIDMCLKSDIKHKIQIFQEIQEKGSENEIFESLVDTIKICSACLNKNIDCFFECHHVT